MELAHPAIRPGDVWRFTCGDCHILARAIQRLTGWPIHCGISGRKHPDWHAFVLTPDGRAVDVRGVQTPAECLRGYQKRAHREFSWDHVRKDWGAPCISSYSYARARAIAPVLVELAEAA